MFIYTYWFSYFINLLFIFLKLLLYILFIIKYNFCISVSSPNSSSSNNSSSSLIFPLISPFSTGERTSKRDFVRIETCPNLGGDRLVFPGETYNHSISFTVFSFIWFSSPFWFPSDSASSIFSLLSFSDDIDPLSS